MSAIFDLRLRNGVDEDSGSSLIVVIGASCLTSLCEPVSKIASKRSGGSSILKSGDLVSVSERGSHRPSLNLSPSPKVPSEEEEA